MSLLAFDESSRRLSCVSPPPCFGTLLQLQVHVPKMSAFRERETARGVFKLAVLCMFIRVGNMMILYPCFHFFGDDQPNQQPAAASKVLLVVCVSVCVCVCVRVSQ